ncbi:hypothetical protein MMC13_007860 [Lambiella insularis]|nr:hypothetical protein [Lambiella insularis]
MPILRPEAPTELPHWFPIIGHTWSFFKDPVKLVETGLNYTKRTREPFAVQIIGRTFYIITAPEDVAAAYRATTVLSFDGFLNEALRAFGVDAPSLKLAWHKPTLGDDCYHESNPVNPKQKPFVHWIKDIYRQALLPGDRMNYMAAHFHSFTDQSLQWGRVFSFAMKQTEKQGSIGVSLKEFTRTIMLEAITDSLFGDTLVKIEPNLIKYVAEFNEEAWMLVHRYPKRFARRVTHNHRKIMDALDKYRQTPKAVRTAGGESWSIETVMTAQEILGMSNESNNAFLMLIHWAYAAPLSPPKENFPLTPSSANSNTSWLCFWLLSHLLWSPSLLAQIRAEIAPAFASGALNLAYLLSSCPRLDAAFQETLRLGGGTVSVRTVTAPITIGAKQLAPGGDVLIMHRALHSNEHVWGADAAAFDPERFLKNKTLGSHASYRPFGGGSTYCPGRVIARQEVFIFVALALQRLDMELVPGQSFPRLDDTQPSIGVTGPRPDMDLFVSVSERRVEKVE